jgi:hypothetical protein
MVKFIPDDTRVYIANILAKATKVKITWEEENGECGAFECDPNAVQPALVMTPDGRIVAAD